MAEEEPTPELLSVRERIERRLAAIVAAVDDIGDAERWDMRGQSRANLSAVIYTDDEGAAEGGMGATPITTCTLRVRVELLIAQAPRATDAEPTARVANRWLARLKAAVLADPQLVEPATGEQLAIDVRYAGCDEPLAVKGQAEFYVSPLFEVTYDEYRDNPYAAPGVTEQTDPPTVP